MGPKTLPLPAGTTLPCCPSGAERCLLAYGPCKEPPSALLCLMSPPRDTFAPHLMQPSILSLIGVMVQVDAVEAGLHLAALSSHHMAAARALPRLHGAPGIPAAPSAPVLAGMPLTPRIPAKTHRLLRAPPTSQSQGRQPGRSWLSPQCSGYRGQGCQGVPGCGATVPSTVHGPRAPCTGPGTAPGTAPLTRHWSQLRPVTSRLQKHSPLTGSHRLPSATVPRGSHWHPAQRASSVRRSRATCPTPAGDVPVLTLAALRVGSTEAEEAGFAAVAAGTSHVLLAAALPRYQPPGRVISAVAQPPIQRALRVAVAGWGCRQGQYPDPPRLGPMPHTPPHRPRHTAGSRRSLLGSL